MVPRLSGRPAPSPGLSHATAAGPCLLYPMSNLLIDVNISRAGSELCLQSLFSPQAWEIQHLLSTPGRSVSGACSWHGQLSGHTQQWRTARCARQAGQSGIGISKVCREFTMVIRAVSVREHGTAAEEQLGATQATQCLHTHTVSSYVHRAWFFTTQSGGVTEPWWTLGHKIGITTSLRGYEKPSP